MKWKAWGYEEEEMEESRHYNLLREDGKGGKGQKKK